MGSRGDKRDANQLRALACEVGVLERADGSARFSQGHSCMLASVVGPADVSVRDELSDRATIEVVCRPKEGTGGLAERALEQRLAHVLSRVIVVEAHPRTTIRCVLQLIHRDGAGLACSVNAACLALMDAGVPLRSCVAAVTLAILPGGDLVLDPTAVEEETATSTFTFAFTNNGEVDGVSNESIMCYTTGDHTFDELTAASESARRAAAVVLAFFRKSAERRLARAAAK